MKSDKLSDLSCGERYDHEAGPLALLVTATVAVVAIAGMMAKDRWDRWQLEKALERQQALEWWDRACRDPTASLERRRQSCVQATALRLGEEAAAKLERELDQVREEERKQAEERKREEEKRMSARPGPFQGEMLELSHDRQANTPKWVQMCEANGRGDAAERG